MTAQITFFAHDVSDATTARRVRMLRLGGADVRLFGFHRSATPVAEVEGVPVVDLGQTVGGRLGARCIQVVRNLFRTGAWKDIVAASDVLLARSLEMATIADTARLRARSKARLAYECLDIHSYQLGTHLAAKAVRRLEQSILKRSHSLVTSSPSFVAHYFDRLGIKLPDIILVENKRVMETVKRPCYVAEERRSPWRIGWFGILRCVRSFEILRDLAQTHPDLVDITLRGRPTRTMASMLEGQLPLNMRFEGPYTEADLARMYSTCDFVWAVEFAGENPQNARWALGNRLYEGGFYNTPVIALSGTAMGEWLEARQTGVRLTESCSELAGFLAELTSSNYHFLRRQSAQVRTDDLVCTLDECRLLVRRLTR